MRFFKACLGLSVSNEEEKVDEVVEKTDDDKIEDCRKKYAISDEKLQEYRKSFNMLDKDNNGTLDTNELGNALHFWGEDPTVSEINSLIEKFDENNNGTVDFPEYLTMLSHRKMESEVVKQCTAVFSSFDGQCNGFISIEDAKKGLENQGVVCSDEQMKAILETVEQNPSGEINYSQFAKILLKRGILTVEEKVSSTE